MQTTAIGTVAKSLPQNVVILLTLLIPKRYIPYTDLEKNDGIAYLCSEYIKIENNDEEVYESDVAGLRMFAEPAGEGTTGYS